jgi:hypothetical protein
MEYGERGRNRTHAPSFGDSCSATELHSHYSGYKSPYPDDAIVGQQYLYCFSMMDRFVTYFLVNGVGIEPTSPD